jgi:cell division protein FtsB
MQRPKQPWIYLIVVTAFAVLVFMVMDFNGRVANLRRLTEEKEKVVAEKNSLMLTQSALEEQIIYATSPAAVENWAYEKGHMVRPGDVPVVPLQAVEVTPTPIVIQESTPEPVSNWDAWRELFFGQSAP